jgi:protein-disulfide isomerase
MEFGDYQCPFCERFFQQSEPQLMKDYIDSGKAKFYFIGIDFLGPDSLTLAEGSWCADEQGKYYEYHDYTYPHQGEENTGWATPDKVKALAAGIDGLDVQRFNSCLDSKKYESRVQQLTSFAQSVGVSGTPTVFVGNSNTGYTQITGAQPYIVFKQVADRYLQ